MNELFPPEEMFPKDNSPLDETRILQTPLYFSEEELKEFKKLCKVGMRIMYPGEALNYKANVSDFLLTTLRKLHGSQENNSGEIN